MSGEIKFMIRNGVSKDRNYPTYHEWYIEVTDENGKNKVKLSPTMSTIKTLEKYIVYHERVNDLDRKRITDGQKKADEMIAAIMDAKEVDVPTMRKLIEEVKKNDGTVM